VQKHQYVKDNLETQNLIIETLKFLCDLETLSTASNEIVTPELALPRLPHEVIFAIGGWSEGSAQTCIETYDTRADRWIRLPMQYEDQVGPRSYHGTIAIGTKLYIIGGFNGHEYFNSCRLFDAVKKKWKEIAPMHIRRCYVSVTIHDGLIYALVIIMFNLL
jgi:kelch-like protein 10